MRRKIPFTLKTLASAAARVSAGFYLPRLRPNLQLRYEFSEWQSNWYVHHIYQDGMTNYGVVLGQWGAQWRRPGDAVGAQSHALELIWDLQWRATTGPAIPHGD